MEALITTRVADFAAALPDGGKLAGLDVGTKTIGLAICDAGWHFAGPCETILRTKFTKDLGALRGFIDREHVVGLVVGLPLNMDGSDGPPHSVGPRLRPQPRPARPAAAAVGRALVDPGGRARDDRRRRQPRPPRRESRCARRRAHPAGRDRRAGQSFGAAISAALVDLLSIDSLTDDQVAAILERATHWFDENRAGHASDRLSGKIVFNLFYENSTRTAMSFATAAHRLGASVVALSVEHSSIKKGETLEDTARTLNAMRPDALVIRHRENGAAADVALIMDAPVINAGDGTNEHPTQALLDAATIRRHFGRDRGPQGRDLRRYPP